MNSKFIKVLVLFFGTSTFFLAGCGPVEMNAQDVASVANEDTKSDVVNKDDQKADAAASDDAPGPEGGCPTGGCPAAAAGGGGCPTGDCEIPPDAGTARAVQMPDTVTSEPVKIIPTGERQMATDIVDYHKTHHVWQPTERHHTVAKHRELMRRWFTKVVYHPTFRRINSIVRTFSQTDQVMPTETVTEPVVDYGCAGAPQPVAVPVYRPVPVPVLGYGKAFPLRF